MKNEIIKIEGIDIVRNEKQILSNITFRIPQGEFVYRHRKWKKLIIKSALC